jgi:tRNA (mo5U34)-methyltransferase
MAGSDDIRDEVASVRWFHSIDLGGGIVTPGAFDTAAVLPRIGMPEDLTGRSVLDVGAWDGFFSFEAERRGAERVVATDSHAWREPGKEGFELARRLRGSSVEDRDLDVMELAPDTLGTFDLVLFLGVLYHMKEPLLGLERVAAVATGQLIVSTAVDLVRLRRPAVAFYPGREYGDDPTNWWGPNPAAVLAMLRSVGFRRTVVFSRPFPSRLRSVARSVRHPTSSGTGRGPLVRHAVFHAWR